tara:strand:+ start:41 stop:823 length:783 start_codon:yes stop_codon:yes gene_type:complete
MSKFGKNEKVVLNENIKPDTLEKNEEDISSNMISNEKPDVSGMDNKQKKKTDDSNLSNTKKIKEDKKKEVKIKQNDKKIKQKTRTNFFIDPVQTVNELHKGLEEINFDNRVNSLNEIKRLVKRTYNSGKMTKMIIGKDWMKIEDKKKGELIEVMEEYIANNYIARFSKLKKVSFENKSSKKIQADFKIVSTLLKLKMDNVNIDYLLSKKNGEWKIFDVILDNSISEVATKKSEFSNYVNEKNIDKLISALKKKNSQLKLN